MLDDELHGGVLGVHVGHLTLETVVAHDCWRENNSQVLGSHLNVVRCGNPGSGK